jgi:hypothetical protein
MRLLSYPYNKGTLLIFYEENMITNIEMEKRRISKDMLKATPSYLPRRLQRGKRSPQ